MKFDLDVVCGGQPTWTYVLSPKSGQAIELGQGRYIVLSIYTVSNVIFARLYSIPLVTL